MAKKNAWIVEPDLIDRFLNVLAKNGFKWRTGGKANEYNPSGGIETVLLIEEELKIIVYERYVYSLSSNDPYEKYNLTKVTEGWLDEMENEDASDTIVYDDPVNHPSHYNHSGVETIEIIRMVLSKEEYRGFLKGNILKYRERAPYKGNAEEDYAKAKWYFDELMTIGF